MNVKKDFLNEIVRLDAIPKHSLAYSSDQSGVTSEEYSKSVFPTCRNHRKQRFIGGLSRRCWRPRRHRGICCLSGDTGNERNLAVKEELTAAPQFH